MTAVSRIHHCRPANPSGFNAFAEQKSRQRQGIIDSVSLSCNPNALFLSPGRRLSELKSASGSFDLKAETMRIDPGEAFAPAGRLVELTGDIRDEQDAIVHYGVGDIHGMRGLLDNLITLMAEDATATGDRAVVVFLGDFVNRGPSSRQVLERLIVGPQRGGDRWVALRGNHEQLLLDAVSGKGEAAFRQWMQKGGAETLESYGVSRREASLPRARRAIPGEHLRFLEQLPVCFLGGGHLFVHAGVDPRLPLNQQSEAAMLNIREPFLRDSHLLPMTVVHGHVPSPSGPVVAPGRIGVDTAAYMSGVLTAVALRNGQQPRFIGTPRDPRAKR